ncbi:MAG: sulfate ABC transporter substrate-binding protein [Planctomycetaceae bacterium]
MSRNLMTALVFAVAIPLLAGCGSSSAVGESERSIELLNVSYDPTRELWRDINSQFIEQYRKEKGIEVSIKQSHGGSGTQARAVIDGLEADVVTLAIWPDTDALRKNKLIADGWEERLPNRSLPYISTIVFVVRKGNPKGIKDWPDLIKKDVEVITPNPKTSGNGKLSFLAAWGDVLQRGGSEDDAQKFVTELYRHTPVLDTGARGSTTTFAQRNIGDVHLTWENEAHLEVAEAEGKLEIVYPPRSIQAEPHVTVVDGNVARKGTKEVAEAYLNFLYTDRGQETIARHFYRPAVNTEILEKNAARFPNIELFPITKVAGDWNAAQSRFFAEGGLFDQIYSSEKK